MSGARRWARDETAWRRMALGLLMVAAVADGCGHVPGNYPPAPPDPLRLTYARELVIRPRYKVVAPKNGDWFDPESYRQRLERIRERLRQIGWREDQLARAEAVLPGVAPRERIMAADVARGNAAYLRLGLVLARRTRLIFRGPGALRLTLRAPAGDGAAAAAETVIVADEGILFERRDRGELEVETYDSRRGPVAYHRRWQDRDRRDRPHVIYVRVPPRCAGWELAAVAVDTARLRVDRH
jgi:hypothetical protein